MIFRFTVFIFLISLILLHPLYSQVDSSTGTLNSQKKANTLVLTKKSTPTKKVRLKTGDRVIVTRKDWNELQGKITDIRNESIHFANDSVSLGDIHSIQKKKPVYTQLLGGAAIVVGGLAILGGQMSDAGGAESTVIGSVMIAGSFFLFYQKRYSHKRWHIEIE
jgi:protein involved in polysaccharide export with SLBB domain